MPLLEFLIYSEHSQRRAYLCNGGYRLLKNNWVKGIKLPETIKGPWQMTGQTFRSADEVFSSYITAASTEQTKLETFVLKIGASTYDTT